MRSLRLLLFATAVTAANVVSAAEVVRAGRWELHSSFWMNLHQALMHDATAPTPRDLGPLTPEQKAAWTAAVAAYREAGGSGNVWFARPMVITQDELSQVADDAMNPGLRGPLADSIRQAAPVYRAHWWAGEDAANRFFIGYAAAMLRDAGEELALAHEAVYRDQLPKSIRADIAANAGRFGAYSLPLRNGGFVVTMSSRDAGFQGLAALEMMLHESSHSIVWSSGGTVGTAITAASKKIGIEPPPDLWHAILFDTSSELTQRALAGRGGEAFVPSSKDLFTRVWPKYREPIEKFWHPYLSGNGTLEEAIEKIVAALR